MNWTSPRDLIAGALMTLVVVAGLIGGGYWAGHSVATADAQEKAITTERAARKQYDEAVKKGQQAEADLIAERAASAARFNELQGAFNDVRKRIPLVARAACPAVPVAVGVGQPPDDPGLSRSAVWMWNSALAGADQPAGACGSADTSEAACSAAAGITLGAAWDNQAVNARLCAEDRLNHQRLIDFLKGRQP